MNFRKASQRISAQRFLVLVLLAVPALMWGNQDQKNTPPPPPSKPPAPSQPAPQQQRPQQGEVRPSGGTVKPAGGTGTVKPPVKPPVENPTAKPPVGFTPKPVKLPGGSTGSVVVRPGGQVAWIHVKDSKGGEMTINHGLNGGRIIVTERNGRTIVSMGAHGGYVQRAYFSRGGRDYYQRTYVINNVTYTTVYRGYYYGGVHYYGYAPVYYYHPVYYGWAYNPWPAPVYYNWGWGGAPGYGYYGPSYFAPYPAYPTAPPHCG